MKNRLSTHTVALTGLLFALALALSYIESALTPLTGLPPGVKIGLANTVVLYALLFSGKAQAVILVILKAAFALFTRGAMAGALSFAGGILSFFIMALLLFPRLKFGILLISIAGAICHNMGQLIIIRLWIGPFSLYYTPVLLISGIIMGSLNALLLKALLPAMKKAGLLPRNDE